MPNYGDVRGDGYFFRGMQRRGGRLYEHWESPERSARRIAAQTEWMKSRRAAIKGDPERLKEHREYHRLYERDKRRSKPELVMFHRAKARAKRSGIDFTIDREHVTIPETCPALGIRLAVSDGCAGDCSPELDRIENSAGYVPGNVIVVSRRANRIKNDSTIAELAAVARFYEALTRRPPAGGSEPGSSGLHRSRTKRT